MDIIQEKIFDEERALYGVHHARISHCRFEGPADGESALKECGDIKIDHSHFALRYPLWHTDTGTLRNCTMSETCRAALWYDNDLLIEDCELNGIKALRECDRIKCNHSSADSLEFGWFCRDIELNDSSVKSEYPFLKCARLRATRLKLKGKYSFQYLEDAEITDSELDTKDAFWHSKNVTVRDSLIKGEYLAWYSENLTLVRCKIIGTQPLCYAKNLRLIDCTMEACDLSFERSSVEARVAGHIDSVKNPVAGHIFADSIGEIIMDIPSECQIN